MCVVSPVKKQLKVMRMAKPRLELKTKQIRDQSTYNFHIFKLFVLTSYLFYSSFNPVKKQPKVICIGKTCLKKNPKNKNKLGIKVPMKFSNYLCWDLFYCSLKLPLFENNFRWISNSDSQIFTYYLQDNPCLFFFFQIRALPPSHTIEEAGYLNKYLYLEFWTVDVSWVCSTHTINHRCHYVTCQKEQCDIQHWVDPLSVGYYIISLKLRVF